MWTSKWTNKAGSLLVKARVVSSHGRGGGEGHVGECRHVGLPRHVQLKRGLQRGFVEAWEGPPRLDGLVLGAHEVPAEGT